MTSIDLSDSLAHKLEDLSGDGDIENVLWKATYLYERNEFPSE